MSNPSKKYAPRFLKVSNEELPEFIKDHYDKADEDYDEEDRQIYKQSALPTMNNPKIFAVQCKPGFEREATHDYYHYNI